MVAVAIPAQAAEPTEYAVKAAYLSKFGSYIEWPRATFSGADGAINLCVVGEDAFGSLIDDAAAAQQGSGRGIVVRRLKSVGRDSGCHIAYLGGDVRVATAVDGLRGGPVLVVTDGGGASTDGGAIHFVMKDNRVRFTIDEDAAAQNGLNISSKLLNLALSVKPRGGR